MQLFLCSESGEMCAMKEVTLFMDDAKSKESAKQLGQVRTCLALQEKTLLRFALLQLILIGFFFLINEFFRKYLSFGSCVIRMLCNTMDVKW